jgi:Zn-finger protein
MENCPGDPVYKVRNDRTIKICTACTFPHRPENYERIIELIRKL